MQEVGHFFWGGYANGRFCGYPQDWYTLESRVILLKGGAGTGKSTLMRRVLAQWQQQGKEAFAFHCASDPSSLDAICTTDRRLCVMDATAPHAVEARFPVAVEEIVDLASGLSRERLRDCLPELSALLMEQQALRLRAGQYLRTAAMLTRQEDSEPDVRPAESALLRCAMRLAHQAFGGEKGEDGEQRAYLSAVTPDGSLCVYDTLTAMCPQVYVLEGDPLTAARLLSLLRQKTAAAGIRAITCPCALRPDRVEHLLLPTVGVAFTTSHRFHEADFPVYRRLSMSRYREQPPSEEARRRRALRDRTQAELLNEAVTLLDKARKLHKREEALYGSAMNWEKAEELTNKVLCQMG